MKKLMIMMVPFLLVFASVADELTAAAASEDQMAIISTTTTLDWIGQSGAKVGDTSAGDPFVYVIPFQLPVLTGGAISNATLKMYVQAKTAYSANEIYIDVVGGRVSSSATVLLTDAYMTGGNVIGDDVQIVNSTVAVPQAVSYSLSPSFFQSIYDGDPAAAGKYVFLMLRTDGIDPAGANSYLTFTTQNGTTTTDRPVLSLTTDDGTPPDPVAPVAAFSAGSVSGLAPLTVTFTDSSTGTITNRFWDFGDGQTLNTALTAVQHTYSATGTYSVSLTVAGPLGASTNSQGDLITVGIADDIMDWYVDPVGGSDTTGDGSLSAPYKTIGALWPQLAAGNLIGLFGGEYGTFDYYTAYTPDPADIFSGWVTFRGLDTNNPPVFESITLGTGIQLPLMDNFPDGPPTASDASAYLGFENLKVTDGVNVVGLKHVRIKNCEITRQLDEAFINLDPNMSSASYGDHIERKAVRFSRVEHVYLEGCDVSHAGHGVYGSGMDINILSNEIHHVYNDGVRIWGFWNSTVEGNRIHHVDNFLTDDEATALYNQPRHSDGIHVGISGTGPCNTNVVIRNNTISDTAGQHIQFNTNGEMINHAFIIEGNILGMSHSNTINDGGTDRLIIRNNTFCYDPIPWILNEGSRTEEIVKNGTVIRTAGTHNNIIMDKAYLRISRSSTEVEIYNNIIGRVGVDDGAEMVVYDYNILQQSLLSAPAGVDDERALGRFTLADTGAVLQDPAALDGVPLSSAMEVLNTGTHRFGAVDFPDVVGTIRDNRPDMGAWEKPGQTPDVEPEPQVIGDFKTIFVEDFEDGHYNDIDPWLEDVATQGMSWYRPSHLTDPKDKFYVTHLGSSLDRNALLGANSSVPRVNWLISDQGINWSSYTFAFDCYNAYVSSGSGPTVLSKDYNNAYWLDIAHGDGRLIRILNGVQTVLATSSLIEMPSRGAQSYEITVSIETNGITVSVAVEGSPVFSHTDTAPAALSTFTSGGIGFHSEIDPAYFKMQFDNIRVEVSEFSDGSGPSAGPPPAPTVSFSGSDSFGSGQDIISWNPVSGSGFVYSVWYSTNLLDGFHLLESGLPDTVSSLSNTIDSSAVFYQVRAE